MFKKEKIRNAILLGSLCSVSYLTVYVARNMLSATTPQMIEGGSVTTEYIGILSSAFFVTYAIGQLINGIIGEKIKARYMISYGLILAGMCILFFPYIVTSPSTARIVYGMSGFFLAMIYAPMTKVVAENTEPIYVTRCSLGYTFASFFGLPIAGVLATLFQWQSAFKSGGVILLIMGLLCFILFLLMEKKGIIKYDQYKCKKEEKNTTGILILLENRIIKFTLISIITGVVRTSVVFWMPTFILQYLHFPPAQATAIFTVATFVISMTAFIAVFLYERLHRNMDLTILVVFVAAAIFFLLVYLVKQPVLNILFLVLAIMSSNCADSMLWSRYCPSLRDTGMVSSATGFLDFVSYMAASASTIIFANATTANGWRNLILAWLGLMLLGIVVSVPWKQKIKENIF